MVPKKSPEAKIPVRTSDFLFFFFSFTFFVKTNKYIPRQERMTERKATRGNNVRRTGSDMGENTIPIIGKKMAIKMVRVVLIFFNNLRITGDSYFYHL